MTDVKIENLSIIPTASTILECRKEFAKNNRKCQFLFDKILAEIGLKKAIDNCTPDKAQKVLDMYKQEHTISNIITTLDLNKEKEIPEEEKPKLPSYKQYLRAQAGGPCASYKQRKGGGYFCAKCDFCKSKHLN